MTTNSAHSTNSPTPENGSAKLQYPTYKVNAYADGPGGPELIDEIGCFPTEAEAAEAALAALKDLGPPELDVCAPAEDSTAGSFLGATVHYGQFALVRLGPSTSTVLECLPAPEPGEYWTGDGDLDIEFICSRVCGDGEYAYRWKAGDDAPQPSTPTG